MSNKAYKITNEEKTRIYAILNKKRIKGKVHFNFNLKYTKNSSKITVKFPVADNTRLLMTLKKEGYVVRRTRIFVPSSEFGHVTKLYYVAEKLLTIN